MLLSFVKKNFERVCPRFLQKPAVKIFRKGREICCRTDMLLFPKKMIGRCPCCGIKLRRFDAGVFHERWWTNPSRYEGIDQNVLCPVCRSLPRHRILASWCDVHKEYLKSAKILYFAPEKCMQLWMKRNRTTYVSADLSRSDTDLQIDIQATGLSDESFDVIFCNHVLEHVDDFRTALKEVYRILIQGGLFICSFPMDPKVETVDEDPIVQSNEERYQRFGQIDHKRVFGMKASQFLTDAGFEVETIKGEDYPEEILPVVGPANYDMNILFCCRKPRKSS